jgi:hypothetical protein
MRTTVRFSVRCNIEVDLPGKVDMREREGMAWEKVQEALNLPAGCQVHISDLDGKLLGSKQVKAEVRTHTDPEM